MSEFDGFEKEEALLKSERVTKEPISSLAKRRGWTREQAIAYGRALAQDECRKLAARRSDFTKKDCDERIKRAEAYAAAEYDEKIGSNS
jgi:hypothetical protein